MHRKFSNLMMIYGQELSVTFDGDAVIVNGEAVSEAVPAAAVANGKAGVASASESAGLAETVEEAFTAEVLSEAILLASVEVNGAQVDVTFDETVALVNRQPVIATPEDSIVVID